MPKDAQVRYANRGTGVIEATQGDVALIQAGFTSSERAIPGDRIRTGDTMHTGSEARAEVVISHSSQLSICSDTALKFSRLEYLRTHLELRLVRAINRPEIASARKVASPAIGLHFRITNSAVDFVVDTGWYLFRPVGAGEYSLILETEGLREDPGRPYFRPEIRTGSAEIISNSPDREAGEIARLGPHQSLPRQYLMARLPGWSDS
jgi:hypothetical protein